MHFVIYRSENNQYFFAIKSANHETVATSETYVYKESAQRTIEAIKKGIDQSAFVIDMTE